MLKRAIRLLAFGSLLMAGRAGWAGTEITNGFVDFESLLIGVKFRYPVSWTLVELGDSVVVAPGAGGGDAFMKVTRSEGVTPPCEGATPEGDCVTEPGVALRRLGDLDILYRKVANPTVDAQIEQTMESVEP